MLKLTVSPGDFIMLGEDIKIVFCGGERSNIPIAIEAPKSVPIVRNTAKDVKDFDPMDLKKQHYIESYDREKHRKVTSIPDKRKPAEKAPTAVKSINQNLAAKN